MRNRLPIRLGTTVAACALAAMLAGGMRGPGRAGGVARAEEPAKPGHPAPPAAPEVQNAPDGAATDALRIFDRDFAKESPALRIKAVQTLGKTIHPNVTAVLLQVALEEKHRDLVRAAAFKGLAAQKPSVKAFSAKVSKFLEDAAEENRKRKAKGDYGVVVDPKTNKTDTESEEGKAALKAKRERGQMLAEAMRAFEATGERGKDDVEVLQEFLSDGNDDLVALALTMLGRWKQWNVLPDMLDLYELYPTEDKVNVGSSTVDTGAAGGADAQAAKRKWMAKFGDPDRRRARPVLVRALRAALTEITGEKFETPENLREYLKRPDVKRKVRAK